MDLRESSRHPWSWFILGLMLLYLGYAAAFLGLRAEHVLGAALFVGVAWLGPRGRRFTMYVLPLWLTAVAYDSFRLVGHLRGPIHVDDLYLAELRWFGVEVAEGRRTLPDVFLQRTHPVLDLLCGFAYIAYLFEPILLCVYFFFRHQERIPRLAWAFLLTNLFGLATYLIYPAAPPWYVHKYGLGPAQLGALPDPAGAAHFDALIGVPVFAQFYSRSPNVFGAMPSLHVAYPLLVFLSVAGLGRRWRVATALFALLVAFAAVYLRHHYVWDVLLGWTFACTAFVLVRAAERWRAARWSGAAPPELEEAVPALSLVSSGGN